MENGNRITYTSSTFTAGTPVDVDLEPASPFQLIDVVVNLSTAATTSETLTIKTSDGTNDRLEAFEDMSTLSSPEDVSKVYRFDKRFPRGTTIKVDFTNTDANTTVIINYQIDQNVL